MKVVVTGVIGTFPVGGVCWDYGQYLLGLEQLGCDVWYLEDCGAPVFGSEALEPEAELEWVAGYLERTLAGLSPGLAGRWHYRHWTDRTAGLAPDALADLLAEADVLLNVSSVCIMREEYASSRCRVLVDTDPGVNHFSRWPGDAPRPGDLGWRGHNRFFTYAERIGTSGCALPDLGVQWRTTRPPVVLDRWSPEGPPGREWTTVMTWNEDWELTNGDRVYGGKEREFGRIVDLPAEVGVPLEVAVGGTGAPVDRWREAGWSVRNGVEVTATADAYRRYVERSRGELSVAKNAYVATGSGWFSCRSACYLAAGRPVVVQDTGFSEVLPTGEGLLAFDDRDGAAAALRKVEADWPAHSAAARALAEEHLSAEVVLGDLLDQLGRKP